MNLWFLLFLLAGVGLMAYGGVMFAFGKRRNAGLIFGAAAVLLGLSPVLGVLLNDTSNAAAATKPAGALAFTYPKPGEALDAQDYLLEGTGTPGDSLELTRDGAALGNITVGADGTWSYYVQAPQVGMYDYAVKGSNGTAALKLSVQQGLTTASNAQCPCRLRIAPNEKQGITGATAVLYKDGAEVSRGEAPFVFTNLAAGEYSFSLEAAGYQSFTAGKASLPKNKNLSVYLEKQK